MKLKFIAYNMPSIYERTNKPEINVVKFCHEVGLQEILTDFEDFLRGIGFRFDGSLEIVDSELEKED